VPNVQGPKSKVRLTTITLVAAVVLCISVGLLIGAVAGPRSTVNAPLDRATTLLSSWNDLVRSIELQNPLFHELEENLRINSPTRVVDVRQLERRRELYKLIVAEHQRQVANLKKMQEADK